MTSKTTSRSKVNPLTYAQESLYFLQQLTNGEPVYNMPQAFRLRDDLNVSALEKALHSLLARHEALRMTITGSSVPNQVAGSAKDLCFRVHRLSPGDLNDRLQQAVREPFDLEKGPVFRVDLFRINNSENVILFNLHHIVGDMASLGIIFDELSKAYIAFAAGAQPSFATQPLQLGSFASERRAKDVSIETLNFWRENLKNYTAEL